VHSAIERAARLIWLGDYSKENLMAMMYAAYFDASGKPDRHPVLSVAGAVASIKKWGRFEPEWQQALKDEGVSEFHATDFAASRKEFRGWKGDKPRRKRFLDRLGKIIKEHTNRLFMVSVEIDAWKSIDQEYLLEETFHSEYALAGFSVVCMARKSAKRKKITAPIEFIFEDGDKGWTGLTKLCAPDGVVPIRLPKEKAIPCQVGDLLAWKNRIACTNSLRLNNKLLNASFPDIESFNELLGEMKSLDKALAAPGDPFVYGPDSLVRTCKLSKVPRRSAIRLPSELGLKP
jgi:hypothetical protein